MSKLIKMGVVPTLHKTRPSRDLRGNLKTTIQTERSDVALPKRGEIKHLLRLWIKSPWEDYQEIKSLSGLTVVLRKGSYFRMNTMSSIARRGGFGNIKCFSDIWHPNVAPIHDLYYFDNTLHLVGEYLELSLDELNRSVQLEEWEIATIMANVLDGALYLLSKGLHCKELRMSNIRLSSRGSIKIGRSTRLAGLGR
jgi:hypothetical protein